MNRLALIAATGFLTLTLTACGEQGNPKQPTPSAGDAMQQQGAAPAPQQQQPQQPSEGQGH